MNKFKLNKKMKTVFMAFFAIFLASGLSLSAKGKYDDDDHRGGGRGHGSVLFEALDSLTLTELQKNQFEALASQNGFEKRKGRKHKGQQDAPSREHGLKELFSKETITNEDLDQIFNTRFQHGNCNESANDKCGKFAEFAAEVHKILTPEQRIQFSTTLKSEIESEKKGSFFKNLFRSNRSEKLKSKLTKELTLSEEQQTLLSKAIPTDEELKAFRNKLLVTMENLAEKFTQDSLTKEEVMATQKAGMEKAKHDLQQKISAKYPQIIAFHSSLSKDQRKVAVFLVDKRGRSKDGWNKRDYDRN